MTTPLTYKHGYPPQKNQLVPMASGAPFQRDPKTSDLKDSKTGLLYKPGTLWPNQAANRL